MRSGELEGLIYTMDGHQSMCQHVPAETTTTTTTTTTTDHYREVQMDKHRITMSSPLILEVGVQVSRDYAIQAGCEDISVAKCMLYR